MHEATGVRQWWAGHAAESYWLEVTDRADIGANLKAPTLNEQGRPFWSYSLVNAVRPGDTVFHYQRRDSAIIGASTARGESWEDVIMWGARGASARAAGVLAHVRPGWYLGLEHFRRVRPPVTLAAIRARQREILLALQLLKVQAGGPLYFFMEVGSKRPTRPMQGYLFKLPRFFVELFPEMAAVATAGPAIDGFAADAPAGFGGEYRDADENCSVARRDPFSVDPALVERGLRGHAETQNGLAAFVKSLGYTPRSPRAGEPSFDLAWGTPPVVWVAEVKSLTLANEERQLRLGLGQVIRYRHLLRHHGNVRALLALERAPSDASWLELCQETGVLSIWPPWQDLAPLLKP